MPQVRGFSVTVGTTPVALSSNGATEPQLTVSVLNTGGAILYAGGSNVVVGQGLAIASNTLVSNLNVAGGRLYGVLQGSQTVVGFEVI